MPPAPAVASARIGYSAPPGSASFDPTLPQANLADMNPNADFNAKAGVASEPAVLSSDGASDRIAQAKGKLTTMSQKGTTVDQNGNATYADGSAVAAPEGSVYNDQTGQYEAADGKKYGVAEFYGENGNAPDDDFTAIQNLFAPLKANLDSNTLSQVNTIQQQYDSLRGKLQEANSNAERSRTVSSLLNGTTRSPATSSGLLLADTSNGLIHIQDLDSKENAAIAAAKTAHDNGDMDLMMKQIDMAEGIRKDKQTAAAELSEKLQTANEKLNESKIQASRDNAVAGLISQGVTDPSKILEYLNTYEDGTSTGGDFSADEVAKTIKSLTVAGTDPKDLPADVAAFNYVKTNFGLPEDIASLPPAEQYFAYLAKLKQAQTPPATAGGYTPLEQRKLRGAGIDPTDTTAADKFLYAKKTKAASDTQDIPSWNDYLVAAEKASGSSYLMTADEDNLKQQYADEYGVTQDGVAPKPFTATEQKKLEQAGLSTATRKEKLDFLYAKKNKNGSTDLPAALQ